MNTMEWIKSLLAGLVGGADSSIAFFRGGRLVSGTIVAGSNVTVTASSAAATITIAATSSGETTFADNIMLMGG